MTNPSDGKLVLLSISDSIPYFDYCISNADGFFYFYLKNAFGTGELALQALLNDSIRSNEISILGNYVNTEPELKTEYQVLNNDETNFTTSIIDASHYKKLFSGYLSPSLTDSFYIAPVYTYPFYGKPSITEFPEFYIDLPDFNEISRELLRGVQFRERKDEISIRLLNRDINDFFSDEPLKLLDGIPIFDNNILLPLGTKDIKKIDAVYYQRFYGDLVFNGVLAVYTQNKPENWAESVSGVKVFNYKFLQPKTDETVINNNQNEKKNLPDLKNVLYRETENQIELNHPVNFSTSDISGQISIRVIAVTKQNSILYSEKLIDVK